MRRFGGPASVLCLTVLVGAIGLISHPAVATEGCAPRMLFSFMPGDAREISHDDSASTDTALIAYEVAPRVSVTTGGDVGFFLFQFAPLSLRVGLFGMFELSTRHPDRLNFLTVPSGPYLWRGLLGYSLAISLDRIGHYLFGFGGALEAAVSFRHESEHVTYAPDFDASTFEDVPNIGDFFMIDLAARKAAGPFVIKARFQQKLFLPTYDSYTVGPGGDITLQWWAHEHVHPFLSLFGEYLFGKERETTEGQTDSVPDNYLVRGLLGVILPGEKADVHIYFAMAYGHDKGVLAFEKGLRYGWGIRVSLFKGE